MPIPTDGIYFRLLNYQSRNVLVANKGIGESKLTDFNSDDPHYDNQIFELIPRGDGTFYIQSVYVPSSGTKGRIFSISGAVGISFLNTGADSTRFTFEEGSGYLAGWYRLVTPACNLVLTDKSGYGPWNYTANGEKYDDQYFQFQTNYREVTKSAET
ncbi:hypothetical protein AnigIFM60653_009008 [Aspergillus niger]|uniref:Ricin B lectin domain-containing protein n=1 Tax=Aspergillus welwitschiae TaxID=1341132 RepID=A0A3F3QGX0_9EURO|nr:hypothetical protein BDQ94DRAFT_166385 [Aspergillus welwitschiae]RDH38182.1 hypothetical protein BDQ94DRAFT_166385 [Aspergillus welwitschiae]GLA07769.1 hypothetical protein AnigIFM60653_009008 [Aspergillus niger]